MNCAFYDISIAFGTQLGHALLKIFGYRPIAQFCPITAMAAIFHYGRHRLLLLPISQVLNHLARTMILVANTTFSRTRNPIVLFVQQSLFYAVSVVPGPTSEVIVQFTPVLVLYDPFGVDVPLNLDNTHSNIRGLFPSSASCFQTVESSNQNCLL